jgi:2-methylcitrate dehydratase PrpD
MPSSHSARLAEWSAKQQFDALPEDIARLTKLRLLDVIGVALPSISTEFGRAVYRAVSRMGAGDETTVIGFGTRLPAQLAALVNGALAHEFEFDDTHNETAIHVSSPVVTAALALAEACGATGRDLLAAVAAGNEIVCRIGVAASGEFYKAGYHPTGVVGAFGATYAACRLLGLDPVRTAHAAGIAGSMTSGSMQSWSDGASAKSLHPGIAAQTGITAARLAEEGVSGPAEVFEGRWGFFHQHVQTPGYRCDYTRMLGGLGNEWESRSISFKPYPTGHLFHAFLDAAGKLYADGVRGEQIAKITCRIADYMVPIVAEPRAEKIRPATTWHGRVSMQFSLAEMFTHGRLDLDSYSHERLSDPALLNLASRVECEVDDNAPGREQWRGWIIVETRDGRRLEQIQPYNRGSPQNPMSETDVEQKFAANTARALGPERSAEIIRRVRALEDEPKAGNILRLCTAAFGT